MAIEEAGHLVIPADSLLLLPARLPYELLGPCMLAAVDAAAGAAQPSSTGQQLTTEPCTGLQLEGIDLQEPVTGPLSTCFTATPYNFLQHLSLKELNVDAQAAAAVGSLIQSSASSLQPPGSGSNSNSSNGLTSLCLQAVFMCQLAWQALTKGLSANCSLRVLRCDLKAWPIPALPVVLQTAVHAFQCLQQVEGRNTCADKLASWS
jgi:hypothetical protein